MSAWRTTRSSGRRGGGKRSRSPTRGASRGPTGTCSGALMAWAFLLVSTRRMAARWRVRQGRRSLVLLSGGAVVGRGSQAQAAAGPTWVLGDEPLYRPPGYLGDALRPAVVPRADCGWVGEGLSLGRAVLEHVVVPTCSRPT